MSIEAIHHFVSYSRIDKDIINPLVDLLRSALVGHGTVFLDSDCIPAGENWPKSIEIALIKCTNVYVFWCNHSSGSDEVQKEYVKALELEKPVIPVLMDDTSLPKELADIQAIDFRDMHLHGPEAGRDFSQAASLLHR